MSRYGAVFVGAVAVLILLGVLIREPAPRPASAEREPQALGCHRSCGNPRTLALTWARASGTWSHRTAAPRLVRLSRLATPPLARRIRRTARTLKTDDGLRLAGARQRSGVIALLIEARGTRRRILVVSRELGYTRYGPDGLGSRHRVYRGTAVETGTGWRMAAWERLP